VSGIAPVKLRNYAVETIDMMKLKTLSEYLHVCLARHAYRAEGIADRKNFLKGKI
jgi:hypothetical protein